MLKKTFACILTVILVLSLCSCLRNIYHTGVSYEIYPEEEIPVYPSAVVFDCTENEQSALLHIAYGLNEDRGNIIEYYKDYFINEQVTFYESTGISDGWILSGTTKGGSAFFIQVINPDGILDVYYETVTEVTVAQHNGALLNENSLSLSSALAVGVLQYYPTGHAAYDAARRDALIRIQELTAELSEKTKTMLEHSASLAQLLDMIWDMTRDEVAWPVLYNVYSANISHLQAACLLDNALMINLPAELRQTAAPLGALKAASCMEDAVIHLLTALSFYASLETLVETSVGETFWARVIDVWEDVEADFDEMCIMREKLDRLVCEVTAVDHVLYDAAMEKLNEDYDTLRESVNEYMDDTSAKNAEEAQSVLDAFDIYLSNDTDDSIADFPNTDIRLLQGGYALGTGLLAHIDEERYVQAANLLDSALVTCDSNHLKPADVSYTTAYNTEDAEAVIALFLLMPLHDALDAPDTTVPVAPPAEPIKPIEVMFPTFTGNAKLDAFHTVMNATLEAANERGYDPDFGAAIMIDEMEDDDGRIVLDHLFGNMELDMLLLGALQAAEDRNNASVSTGQNRTLTGDEELDKLLAIILTQKSAEAETSTRVNMGRTDNLPGQVKETTDRICDDPTGKKLVDRDIPISIEGEADVNNALFVMMDSGDNDSDDETGADVLMGSLNSQINAAVSAKTSDSDDFLGSLAGMLAATDALKNFQSMLLAQSVGNAIEDFEEQFSRDPEKAVEEAVDHLKQQLTGLNGFEQWAELLEGFKGAVGNNLLWQALADAVTGDYTALLTLTMDTMQVDAGNANDAMVASPTPSGVASPSPSQDSSGNNGVIPVEFDYTGYYALEFTLLDVSFEMQPYNPDNHLNPEPPFDISQSEWEQRAEKEQEELVQDPNFSYKTDKIQIWHTPGSDTIEADLTMPVDIAYQTIYELEDGSGMVNSTIYFRPDEYSDGFGYITFIGGDDGSIAIVGEVTEFFEGALNKHERHFRIDGVLISEEEYYSW